jgi:CRISPR-associated endonuclease/helicase Cas3
VQDQHIAHVRKTGELQLLVDHLSEVGDLCGQLSAKIGLEKAGELIGLLHDFGKFSGAFQNYIGSATGVD